MKRVLSTERTYSLEQYNNIKFFDSIEVPEEWTLDLEMISKVRLLQMVQNELAFRRYLKLKLELHGYDTDTAIQALEELRLNTLDELNQTKEENND